MLREVGIPAHAAEVGRQVIEPVQGLAGVGARGRLAGNEFAGEGFAARQALQVNQLRVIGEGDAAFALAGVTVGGSLEDGLPGFAALEAQLAGVIIEAVRLFLPQAALREERGQAVSYT